MKYLKRFNEELSPFTYRKAEMKLKKLGHLDRSKKLGEWGRKMQDDENLITWKEQIEKYGKYGTFKLNVVAGVAEADGVTKAPEMLKDDFYLGLIFGSDDFECNIQENPNDTIYLSFMIGIIPTSEELINKCNKIMPEPFFDNGFYWALTLDITFKIVNNSVEFGELTLRDMDPEQSGYVSLADRQTAGKFKSLVKKIFSDPDFDYPSGQTDIDTMWRLLERTLMVEGNMADLNCGDFGFELHDISDYVNKTSPNNLYKTI